MIRYYLKWKDDGQEFGPYPTRKMAEFMRGSYEVLIKRESEVVERHDKS